MMQSGLFGSGALEPVAVVLLVEDDSLISLSLQDSLEEEGFSVRLASDGSQALALLDVEGQALAAVLTDIRLGAGPTGWDVARHAREAVPHIPVVYLSGDSAGDHSAYGVPDSVMLQKPFLPAQLITALSMLLNAASTRPPNG